ncbi:hypothetical protein [Zobellia amurskyensis]|nr:hypothetical protein [Zobellia amurskyensis]
MSSNLHTACIAIGAVKAADYFELYWKAEGWNSLLFWELLKAVSQL